MGREVERRAVAHALLLLRPQLRESGSHFHDYLKSLPPQRLPALRLMSPGTPSHRRKDGSAVPVNPGCKSCPFVFGISVPSDKRTVISAMSDAGDGRWCLTRREDHPGTLGQRLGDATVAWGHPANRLLS